MKMVSKVIVDDLLNKIIDSSDTLESKIREIIKTGGAGMTKKEQKELEMLEEILDSLDVQEKLRKSLDIDFKSWYVNRLTEMGKGNLCQET